MSCYLFHIFVLSPYHQFLMFVLFQTGGGGGGVDYEELLNQKRRDEARYRHGNDPYNDYARSGQLKSSTSDGFLNRVAPSYNSQGINQEMEDLSRAVKIFLNTNMESKSFFLVVKIAKFSSARK